jgi:hypothetical protein
MADAFDQTGPSADASAIGRWNSALANAAKRVADLSGVEVGDDGVAYPGGP